jgi:hypothetical protein
VRNPRAKETQCLQNTEICILVTDQYSRALRPLYSVGWFLPPSSSSQGSPSIFVRMSVFCCYIQLVICADKAISLSVKLWHINITITIVSIIPRPVFYLKHRMDNFRTSREAHHVSATNPPGQCDLYVCDDGILI